MSDIGLRIRVDDQLRHDFVETCKAKDTTAAQVLRSFMRTYVEEHGARVRQGQLFSVGDSSQPLVSQRLE
jgi:hypothetical protein